MKRKILELGKFLSKILLLIASNAFISGLFVFFAAFILAGLLFCSRVFWVKEEKGAAVGIQSQIDEGSYQKFLDFQQKQEAVFNRPICQGCRDIFKNPSAPSKKD